jgi:hypothetical protein
MRLEPWWPTTDEIHTIFVYNFIGWEVPRFVDLSVFENHWLDNLKGYRHREVHSFLETDRDRRDAAITMKLYGTCALPENVRWPPR